MLDFLYFETGRRLNVQQEYKRILVVDDEENARVALSKILSHDGYDVSTASNGQEALNFLRSKDVELIITDLNMPEMNGLMFLRELNRTHPASNVIMITAYGEVESYLEAMTLGVFEYINKPVRYDDLKKTIDKIFKTV
ncbi:MAG: two-component system response regulator [Geobacteraceae bacterium GWB2_52_12]|nr:MAG: two-component system response regulator [Geobacteraceae bacterium GWB2_52_12]